MKIESSRQTLSDRQTDRRTNICISLAPDGAKKNKSTSPEVILRCGTGTDDADINTECSD